MDRNKLYKIFGSRNDLFAMVLIVFLTGFYVSPLLINLSNSFVLFPKNIPSSYGAYPLYMFISDSIFNFHSFPLWVPILQGGRFIFEHPVINILNPSLLLTVLFGEVSGMNLSWCFLFVIGSCSMYYLMRRVLKYSILGSIYSALVFPMSGVFGYLFENGVFYAKEAMLLPLALAFLIKARDDHKFVILCSFILSIMIQTALFFPVIMLFLFLFINLYSWKYENKRIILVKGYLWTFFSVSVLTFLFSAVKILPMLRLLMANNRISGIEYSGSIDSANTLGLLFKRIFLPEHSGPGTMYLGCMPVILALLAVVFNFKKAKAYFILLCIFIFLSFGPNIFLDLHRFLWKLPVFSSMKEISKYYSVIIVFIVAILSGTSLPLFGRVRNRVIPVLLAVLLIFITYFDLLNSNIGYFNVLDIKPVQSIPEKKLYHIKGINMHQGDESIMTPLFYFMAKKNIDIENFPSFLGPETRVMPKFFLLPRYAFLSPYTKIIVLPNPEYKGEAFFLKDSNSTGDIDFKPNRISVEIKMKEPDILVINQNFDFYWQASAGAIENHDGLLSVRLKSPIHGRVFFTYLPFLFFIGIAVSLISLTAGVYFLFLKT